MYKLPIELPLPCLFARCGESCTCFSSLQELPPAVDTHLLKVSDDAEHVAELRAQNEGLRAAMSQMRDEMERFSMQAAKHQNNGTAVPPGRHSLTSMTL